MRISKELELDMGHAVTNHNSKCKHLHGHRYRIRTTVDDKLITEGSAEGMVIDFSDLKKCMMDVLDAPFDHAFVIWEEDPRVELLEQAHEMWHNDYNKFHLLPFVPTAENLARYWFALLKNELDAIYNIKLYQIEVWETPTSCAVYTIEEFEKELSDLEDMLKLVSKEEIE
ncbi:MAG: 6-carboxytetrahydropterin synthase [Actinobacteria bacterium]|nr:6-carboxytetrahydropterin synthase [Actinomycetota bacterium]